MSDYTVTIVPWTKARDLLMQIRDQVFVVEQNVPMELEHDAMDVNYIHALAMDADEAAIGTGRLLPDGKIGRMAVLKSWRGHGVGRALLSALIEQARQENMNEVKLGSQIHAQEFYAREGFIAFGEEYMEAGIAHIKMRKTLQSSSLNI